MKTNHQRGFKDTRDPRAVFNSYCVWSRIEKLPLSDRDVGAAAFVTSTNSKHGIAKSRRGAKKFVNSRRRFHEDAALKKIAKELE